MKHRQTLLPRVLAAALVIFAAVPASADIEVSEGWSRETVPGATEGVGYLTIRNTGDEARTLMRLTSTVSDSVMMHLSSIDAQGIARMWPVASLRLQPGETVRFEPNGKHLMFRELNAPFKVGAKVPVTFEFDKGEKPVTAQLVVRSLLDTAAPATMDHSKHARH